MFEAFFIGQIELRVFKGAQLLSRYPLGNKTYSAGKAGRVDEIFFSDYTGDGRVEFPIMSDSGQSGGDYQIFALSPTGSIEPLGDPLPGVDIARPFSTSRINPEDGYLRVPNPSYDASRSEQDPNYGAPEWHYFKWYGNNFIQVPSPPTASPQKVWRRRSRSEVLGMPMRPTASSLVEASPTLQNARQIIGDYLSNEKYDPARRLKDGGDVSYASLGSGQPPNAFREALQDFLITEPALIRNEIFARHGYSFQKYPWDQIFTQVNWYKPDPTFTDSAFTMEERSIIKTVKREERVR